MPGAVMGENPLSFRKMLEQSEEQELEAPGGISTPQVYSQLLALYLLHNDMPILQDSLLCDSLGASIKVHKVLKKTAPDSL